MKKNRLRSLVLPSAGVLLLSTMAIGASSTAVGATPIGGADLVEQFRDAQTQADVFEPAFPPKEHGSFEPTTPRYLGENGAAEYWVAQKTTGEICLIARLHGQGAHVSSSCILPFDFYRHGLALHSRGAAPSQESLAYLLPMDVDATTLLSSKLDDSRSVNESVISQDGNFITVDPSAGLAPAELKRANGQAFTFQPLVLKD